MSLHWKHPQNKRVASPLIVYTLNRCTIKTIGFLNKAFKCSYGKMTSQGISGITEKRRTRGAPHGTRC